MHKTTESGEIRDIFVTGYTGTDPVISEDEDTAGGGTGAPETKEEAEGATDDAEDDAEDAGDGADVGADDSDDSDDTTDDADQTGSGEGDEVGRDVVDRGRQFAGAISGADGHPIWQ